jgi:DNA helicase-2/ATP-dependent DNA helicase PcrA
MHHGSAVVTITKTKTKGFMHDLDGDQRVAVLGPAHYNLVIAGPGSGKTKTLIARVCHDLEEGVEPHRVVAITYTNAAASEVASRLNVAGVAVGGIGFLGTIHGYLLRLLRAYGQRLLHLPERLAVMDEDQDRELLDGVVKDFKYRGKVKELKEAVAQGWQPQQATGTVSMNGPELVAFEYYSRMLRYGLLSFAAVVEFGEALVKKLAVEAKDICDALYVDEYQDTSYRLHRIFMALPCPRKFVVGDPDQAIFGFTGATVRNVITLSRDPSWAVTKLEANYRSGETICETAQQLIEHNRNRVPKVTVCRTSVEGQVDIWTNLPSDQHEYFQVAREIMEKEHGSVAVLARTRFICQQVAIALEGRGLPVRRRHQLAEPHDWGVARKLITLLANPDNDYVMFWFLCYTRSERYAEQMKMQAATALTTINAHTVRLPKETPVSAVPNFIAASGVKGESVARITKAVEMLRTGATVGDLSLLLESHEVHEAETGDGVTVTTMHAAKGREWDWVFIVGCDAGIVPSNKKDSDIEEERRLFYVAITRARMRVVISTANQRLTGDWQRRPEPATPSPFIAEIQ